MGNGKSKLNCHWLVTTMLFKIWELKDLRRHEVLTALIYGGQGTDNVGRNLHCVVVSLGFLGVLGCRVIYSWVSSALSSVGQQAHIQSSSAVEEQLDPFSLVADELSILANRLRSMVVAEVPKLASAAEYFFKMGVEGKRFRPTVLLLMATALDVQMPRHPADAAIDTLSTELRSRQQCIAEITEMIHVASLLHDDVLDDADTRRGIGSLNFVMGNKLAVLAGDFLLSRACVALASLKNTEVVSLLAKVVEHLVTGETMQMTTTSDQRCNMEYYMQKTYYKTASLISNSCKAIALLAGQTAEVSILAYEYGKNLGLAYQLIDDVLDFTGTSTSLGKGSLSDIRHGIITAPILFAMEEFPELRTVVNEGFDSSANVDRALEYLGKSRGIQRTRELAAKHASLASAAIDSFPENNDENVQRSRRALVELTHRVITRTNLPSSPIDEN
ncbi:UNVERIFIED_CONTAM: Solanesyl diphosphate synthase 3, chloroplastic/mitochondrial [Sesamum indicum]